MVEQIHREKIIYDPDIQLSPKAGKTVLRTVKEYGKPLFVAHSQLFRVLMECSNKHDLSQVYIQSFYSFKNRDEIHLTEVRSANLISSAIILTWICGKILGQLEANTSLLDAVDWLYRDKPIHNLISTIPHRFQEKVIESLQILTIDSSLVTILPYAVEVLETDEELLSSTGKKRQQKRTSGIFYTPTDVSEMIVRQVHESYGDECEKLIKGNWLDPACGSGVFLIAVINYALKNCAKLGISDLIEFIVRNLYGIDKSPEALQAATYNLALRVCLLDNTRQFGSTLSQLKSNFYLCDSTKLDGKSQLGLIFPKLIEGVDFLVSNPPYSKRNSTDGQLSLFQALDDPDYSNRPTTSSGNTYLEFVEMLFRLTKIGSGIGGMVVPLSIAYNEKGEFQRFREKSFKQTGVWRFSHFDRTPDSLFGDDVKIRCTVAMFKHTIAPVKVFSTNLLRWSSRTRANVLKHQDCVEVTSLTTQSAIPKIGDEFGMSLLQKFSAPSSYSMSGKLHSVNVSELSKGIFIRNKNTAYNWLPFEVYRINLIDQHEINYSYWDCEDEAQLYSNFAILMSRYSYWLWRVWGDGFHLPKHFIKNLPISSQQWTTDEVKELSNLGLKLWLEMKKSVLITNNAGVDSVSYAPYKSAPILNDIDQLITQQYSLPIDSNLYVREFIENTIVAGRDTEIYSNSSMSRWAKGVWDNAENSDGN